MTLKFRGWLRVSLVIIVLLVECSFLAHASDIDDLLEGLDSVLKDWLNRLHDTESSLHIVNLWLHALNGLHLSGNLDEWLSVIESLEDSGGEGLLDVLDGSSLGNGGIGITSGLAGESGGEGGLEVDKEVVFVHVLVSVGSNGGDEGGGEFHLEKSLIYSAGVYRLERAAGCEEGGGAA